MTAMSPILMIVQEKLKLISTATVESSVVKSADLRITSLCSTALYGQISGLQLDYSSS